MSSPKKSLNQQTGQIYNDVAEIFTYGRHEVTYAVCTFTILTQSFEQRMNNILEDVSGNVSWFITTVKLLSLHLICLKRLCQNNNRLKEGRDCYFCWFSLFPNVGILRAKEELIKFRSLHKNVFFEDIWRNTQSRYVSLLQGNSNTFAPDIYVSVLMNLPVWKWIICFV